MWDRKYDAMQLHYRNMMNKHGFNILQDLIVLCTKLVVRKNNKGWDRNNKE